MSKQVTDVILQVYSFEVDFTDLGIENGLSKAIWQHCSIVLPFTILFKGDINLDSVQIPSKISAVTFNDAPYFT